MKPERKPAELTSLKPFRVTASDFRCCLDTGTNDIMLFKPCLRGGLQQLPVQGKGFNLNAGGRDSLAVVEVSGVNLGRFSWKKRKAYVWDALPDQIRDFDGMIGPAALSAQGVAFDFDRRVVSLEIPRWSRAG